jgi:hypothetical protein
MEGRVKSPNEKIARNCKYHPVEVGCGNSKLISIPPLSASQNIHGIASFSCFTHAQPISSIPFSPTNMARDHLLLNIDSVEGFKPMHNLGFG